MKANDVLSRALIPTLTALLTLMVLAHGAASYAPTQAPVSTPQAHALAVTYGVPGPDGYGRPGPVRAPVEYVAADARFMGAYACIPSRCGYWSGTALVVNGGDDMPTDELLGS